MSRCRVVAKQVVAAPIGTKMFRVVVLRPNKLSSCCLSCREAKNVLLVQLGKVLTLHDRTLIYVT